MNALDDVNSFLPDQLNWGWMGYGCCNSLFNDGNWDSENPIMSGIDPDSLNFFSAYTMLPEPSLIESGIIDPIIRLGWNSPWGFYWQMLILAIQVFHSLVVLLMVILKTKQKS